MRTRALLDFCSWLEQTPLSQTIQSTGWIVPAVQTVHILSIAAVLSSVLMIDLRLMGFLGRDQPLARVSARFLPVIWWTDRKSTRLNSSHVAISYAVFCLK